MLRAEAVFEQLTGFRPARLAPVVLAVLASGCSSLSDEMPNFLSSSAPGQTQQVADNGETPPPQDDLQKATEYWRKEYEKKPRELDPALNYAKNLKAMGQKGQALGVLQQASLLHGADRKLASEYGRLALELDQINVADKLLSQADDPASPDWRIVSARGTVLSKQGKYAEAIPFYEKALKLSEGKASILNNLALAHAMNGDAPKGEELLRQAAAGNGASARTRQNLALVLGLQGKYDEATRTAAEDLPQNTAAANTALVRNMVKLEPKVMPHGVVDGSAVSVASAGASAKAPAVAGWSTKVAAAAPAPKTAAAAPTPAPTPVAAPAALPWAGSGTTGSVVEAAPAVSSIPGGPAFKPSAQ